MRTKQHDGLIATNPRHVVKLIGHFLQVPVRSHSNDNHTLPSAALSFIHTLFQPLLLLVPSLVQLLPTKPGVLQIASSTRWKEAHRHTGPFQ